jgi:hypothetical protein
VAAVAERDMPAADRVAIVVVGKASEVKAPLEQAFGTVQTVPAAECDALARAPK